MILFSATTSSSSIVMIVKSAQPVSFAAFSKDFISLFFVSAFESETET